MQWQDPDPDPPTNSSPLTIGQLITIALLATPACIVIILQIIGVFH